MSGLSLTDGLDPAAIFAPLDVHARLALAVSGGPDSLALMLLAHRHATATGGHRRFLVYSVDHGLRPEAAAEAAFVVREATRLGFSARVLHWEGPKPATGLQQAARTARYRLFAAAMAEDRVDALLTAHHLADQAETVLMRLAHGSGVEGLRGMDAATEIEGARVLRPLLGVDPEALGAVVREAGLTPIADPGNENPAFERVRWRKMAPALAELGLDARRLGKFAERMRDADAALAAMADDLLSRVAFDENRSAATIDREDLCAAPRAVAERALARLLDIVGGGQKPHALAAVETLTARLLDGAVRTTLHGCIVRGSLTEVHVAREPGRSAVAAARVKEPSGA